MKKLPLAILVISITVLLFTSVVPAGWPLCPYCGVSAGEYDTYTTQYESYKVPCAHDKFGTDLVTITYQVHRAYCNSCHHVTYERWFNQGESTVCQGWVNPDASAPILVD